jgi:MSHA biogenesis protein MshK
VPESSRNLVFAVLMALSMVASADTPLPDPTRPDVAAGTAPLPGAAYTVTAIFFSDERRNAVVNGKLVAQGDQVDGARVMQIRPDALDLMYRGETITRRLPSVGLRKP